MKTEKIYEIRPVGTQLDGPGHIGMGVTMADGSVEDVYIENLALDELARDGAYEFLFVFTPVRFKGATGSPGRPIAIR